MVFALLALAPALIQEPTAPKTPTLTGNVKKITGFESKILGNKRGLVIYTPPDYEKQEKARYPVLYCHDGQNIFDGATSYIRGKEWRIDEAANALILAGLIEPIIIVGIENAGIQRSNEYLPTRFKFQNTEMGGKGDLYGRFLLEEVKAYVDREYRTKPDAKNTALMGSSLGGFITYYLGLKHPDKFSKLGVVSPSVWANDREMVKMTDQLPRKLPLKIWIDMGTQESLYAVPEARMLFDSLLKKGWAAGKDAVFYQDGFAQHNEDAWARRVPAILMWMFGVKR
ncbi:MAG: alpha/beta hydrolase [Chlorobia bacterium]|nr:alpha/beta hydrolase [Fimbriimonadaceae bacterium]